MGRSAGRLLMAIGFIHVVFFLWVGRGPLGAIVQEGLLNAVDPHKDRQMIFWSLCFGVMAFFLGQMICWVEAQGRPTPAHVGWGLLGLSVFGAALMPISGWWLVMVSSVLLLLGARRKLPAPESDSPRARGHSASRDQ